MFHTFFHVVYMISDYLSTLKNSIAAIKSVWSESLSNFIVLHFHEWIWSQAMDRKGSSVKENLLQFLFSLFVFFFFFFFCNCAAWNSCHGFPLQQFIVQCSCFHLYYIIAKFNAVEDNMLELDANYSASKWFISLFI